MLTRNPVWMLKPQSNTKRRMVGKRLAARRGPGPVFDEEAIKEKLQEIRNDVSGRLDDLIQQFESCQERYGVKVFSADTAQVAAQRVAEIAGPERSVLVNRSATVNEIRPALVANGLLLQDSYDDEFERPEEGVQYYWELDMFEPEAVWESFIKPTRPPRPDPTEPAVALIGVNTISAEDGTAYLVEHLGNISRSMQTAEKIIWLVGLDKIAPTAEDACFIAQAMALFGAPSVAMTAAGRGHDSNSRGKMQANRLLKELLPEQEWYVLLLDNGRRRLLDSPFRSLFTCIGCRACLRECPTFPYLGENAGLSPRDQLWRALRGDGYELSNCVSCGRCKKLCPLEIDLPLLISQFKAERQALKDQFFKRIDVLLTLCSATAPLTNAAFSMPGIRRPIEWVSSLDHRRTMPRFANRPFVRTTNHKQGRSSGKHKMVYYYGCYVNYTDPALGQIVVSMLERNGCEVAIPPQTCCGVAAFWYGDKKIARRYAQKTISTLLQWVNEGYQVLVTCPSCGLALKQDFLYLFPDDADVNRLAENTWDASTFIMRLMQTGEWEAPENPIRIKVGYHTPCHLRIRGIGDDSLALLASIPGMEVVNIDRGCCGLAGSYGMRAKNYNYSMEIGERIAGFIRFEQLDAAITDCAGCEMQLRKVTGLPVYHPVKLLWKSSGGNIEGFEDRGR
ncbi:MAG: anaerobic glycerol-3-phosphate dehydrogenase subunit C [Anaerolineales bacterium]|nr:anaerobic glycerol-3-phosphate dehydrogenase subunit C [Anaerolineales bacterium]